MLRFQYVDSMTFKCAEYNLESTITFNPDQKGMFKSLFSRAPKSSSDTVRGEIVQTGQGKPKPVGKVHMLEKINQ